MHLHTGYRDEDGEIFRHEYFTYLVRDIRPLGPVIMAFDNGWCDDSGDVTARTEVTYTGS